MTLRPIQLADFASREFSEPVSPPPPSVETQVNAAYAEGFQAGAERAREAQEAQLAGFQSSLGEEIADLTVKLTEHRVNVEHDMLRLLTSLFDSAFPPLLARHYCEIVVNELRDLLGTRQADEIIVEVPPSLQAAIAQVLPEGIAHRTNADLDSKSARLLLDTHTESLDLDHFATRLRGALDLEGTHQSDSYEMRAMS